MFILRTIVIKLGTTWKEEVVAYFKVSSRNLPGGTSGNHGDSRPRDRESNPGHHDYETRVL